MGRVRYAKSLRDLESRRSTGEDALEYSLRQIRCVYETDAEVAQAVVPRPLEATTDPEVHVSITTAVLRVSPASTIEFSTMSFGVGVHYDGRDAIYPLTMAMTNEALATEGRERYGLPNKLARIRFDRGSANVRGAVERRDIDYLILSGEFEEDLSSREDVEETYHFKAFPGCQPSKGFDQDPLLVRIESRYSFDRVYRLQGRIELAESSFDPVADLPVRRMASLEFVEGHCRSSGRVLRPVPEDWLDSFLHQRSDAPEVEGLDV